MTKIVQGITKEEVSLKKIISYSCQRTLIKFRTPEAKLLFEATALLVL
jgi:hypothetical protein